jgi:transcriptional regulator with XRE-family HTH domain
MDLSWSGSSVDRHAGSAGAGASLFRDGFAPGLLTREVPAVAASTGIGAALPASSRRPCRLGVLPAVTRCVQRGQRLALIPEAKLVRYRAPFEVTLCLPTLPTARTPPVVPRGGAVMPAHRVVFLPGEAFYRQKRSCYADSRIMLHSSADGKGFVKGFLVAGDSAAEFFGRALAAARSERGLKRMQLKEKSGLSYPYISEIENGGKYPSQRAIQNLADALEMSPSELLARAEQLEAAESGGRSITESVSPEPAWSVSESLPAPRLGWDSGRSEDDELVRRLTDQVIRAIEVPLRELVSREVQMTIREELLRQRDGR